MGRDTMNGECIEPTTDANEHKGGARGNPTLDENGSWWTRASLALVSAAAAILASGCTPNPFTAAAESSERAYVVTPDSVRARTADLVADIVRMKVTERVEDHSGRITSPAKLTGRLFLENVSRHQALRLIAGHIVYLDVLGQAIPMEAGRPEPSIRFAMSGWGEHQLEPGKVATELLYAEFPTQALGADRLMAIRVKLIFSSTPGVTNEQNLNFAVSIEPS